MTRKYKYDIVDSLATVSRRSSMKVGEVLKKKKGREEKTSSFFRKTNSQHKESVTVEKKAQRRPVNSGSWVNRFLKKRRNRTGNENH